VSVFAYHGRFLDSCSLQPDPAGSVWDIPNATGHMHIDNAGVGGGELPVRLGVVFVAAVLPSGDFLDQGLLVGDAPVEALG